MMLSGFYKKYYFSENNYIDDFVSSSALLTSYLLSQPTSLVPIICQ